MARSNDRDLPDTDEGHLRRIDLAMERCRVVLSSDFAQSEVSPIAGVPKFTLMMQKRLGETEFQPTSFKRVDEPAPLPQLIQVLITSRVFVLGREQLHWQKLAGSLRRFTDDDRLRLGIDALSELWERYLSTRYNFHVSGPGVEDFPKEGVTDGKIADRYMYSQIAHSDDAHAILDEVDDREQIQALTTLAGDCAGIVSFQEKLISDIFPERYPEITSWAGDPRSIFYRLYGHEPGGEQGEK